MADLLVINAGSSSIKFRVYEVAAEPQLQLCGQVDGLYTGKATFRAEAAADGHTVEHSWPADEAPGHAPAVGFIGKFLRSERRGHELAAVGHRVVHGGVGFSQPVLATPEVVQELAALAPLAPLHQPHNLAPIQALSHLMPRLPQVACFDTAFHRTQPDIAQAFALPEWVTSRGVRRYGFHGLSYEFIAGLLPSVSPEAAAGRTVVAHLGNGASMCALQAGRSVASTMGFTAVDGLPMGTRCGNVDPGAILYLVDELKMGPRAVEDMMYKKSGLLGVSGISADMRVLLASDDLRARFAVELFTYRIGRELGSLAAALGGLDALVFTAGIGEHAPLVRDRVCRDAAWLGIELDQAANAAGATRISTERSRVSVWVIPTQEELMIARHTLGLTGAGRP